MREEERKERRREKEMGTEIDGIESERVAGRVEAGGDANVYVCNAVHRTSRSRMKAGGERRRRRIERLS